MADMSDDKRDPGLSAAEAARLEGLFADAREARLPRGFLARVNAAALAEMPAARPAPPGTGPDRSRRGRLAGLVAGLGGWPVLGGLTAALVLGFGIGLAPPDGLASLTGELLGNAAAQDFEDVFWTFDSTLLEG